MWFVKFASYFLNFFMIRKYFLILLSEGPKSALPWQSKYILHLQNICYDMTYIYKGYIWIYVETMCSQPRIFLSQKC